MKYKYVFYDGDSVILSQEEHQTVRKALQSFQKPTLIELRNGELGFASSSICRFEIFKNPLGLSSEAIELKRLQEEIVEAQKACKVCKGEGWIYWRDDKNSDHARRCICSLKLIEDRKKLNIVKVK